MVGFGATRLLSEVAVSGEESDFLDNDAGCDVVLLDPEVLAQTNPETISIGAIAIGNEDAQPFINWPKDPQGSTAHSALLCMYEDYEPEGGTVLFLTDQQR
jgi:hypothetical protein